jgi:hypothetical protein
MIQILNTYEFKDMFIYDVSSTRDGLRLLAVGSSLRSDNGRKPSKSRTENRIISKITEIQPMIAASLTSLVESVYNIAEKKIERFDCPCIYMWSVCSRFHY